MSDVATSSSAFLPVLPPVEDRGRTTLSGRAWRRLAETAATGSATEPVTSAVARVVDSGGRVRVDLDIVAPWRPGLVRTAAGARSGVGRQLQQQTGDVVDAVDVHVTRIDPGRAPVTSIAEASAPPADPSAPVVEAARIPRRPPPVLWLGILLPLALGGLGALALREAAVGAGLVAWPSWVESWFGRPLTWEATDAVVPPAAAGLLLAGAVLLLVTLWPGRRDAVPLFPETGTWTRPVGLARVASEAAEEVPGVVEATAVTGRRRLVVHVRTTSLEPVDEVTRTVTARLAALARPPTVRVRATALDGTRRSG